MKRIISILLFFLIFSLVIRWDCIHGQPLSLNQIEMEVFKPMQSEIISSSLSSWGRVYGSIDEYNIKGQSEKIIHFLLLNPDTVGTSDNYSDNLRQVQIKGQNEQGSVVTVKIESYMKDNRSIENNLLVEINHNGELDLKNMCLRLKELYSKYNSVPNINACVVGTVDGEMDENKRFSLQSRAEEYIHSYAAREKGKAAGGWSILAFSPNIIKSVEEGEKKFNEKFSIKYNSQENKTYIWVSIPVSYGGL